MDDKFGINKKRKMEITENKSTKLVLVHKFFMVKEKWREIKGIMGGMSGRIINK